MPWNSAASPGVAIVRLARSIASDRRANLECRVLCRTLKRFLGSRELSAELKRVLRPKGPTHESKHFLKTSEFYTQEATRLLKSYGLDVVMYLFFKARTAPTQSR